MNLKSIAGKIVNYNNSFFGEISFDNKIIDISKKKFVDNDSIIIPGFIDLHCHGGGGFDTMNGIQSIVKMSNYHLANGTTSILPTTLTDTFDNTFKALNGLSKFINKNKFNSNILGVHLEGPFINSKKLGAQPPKTQKPNIEFIEKILKIAPISVVTIAPELKGANYLIEHLINKNIKVQIGHSLADYKCCVKIMNNNTIGITHLFNAMSGCDHRNPGVVSAALNHAEYAEIICDLYHVDQANIHLAHKCIPKLYAITDAMPACGMPDGKYDFANLKVDKIKGRALINGTTLAGSVINMHKTFKNLIKINFALEQAVAMTSFHAAKYLNEIYKGKIDKGFDANLVVLDKHYDIKKVYLYGQEVNPE